MSKRILITLIVVVFAVTVFPVPVSAQQADCPKYVSLKFVGPSYQLSAGGWNLIGRLTSNKIFGTPHGKWEGSTLSNWRANTYFQTGLTEVRFGEEESWLVFWLVAQPKAGDYRITQAEICSGQSVGTAPNAVLIRIK